MKFISDIKWLSLITETYFEGVDAHSCHVPYGSGPHLPVEVSSGAVTCPTGPYGPRASSIKESLAGLPVQLGTHVFNARAHVSTRRGHHASVRRAGWQYSQYMQGVRTCIYSAFTVRLQCDANTMDHSPTVPSNSTVRHHTAN
jgi:hypothetical protein